MKATTSKWNDPAFKSKYGKKWREQRKLELAVVAGAVSPDMAGGMTKWQQRSAERKARQEASQPHPLPLETCPFCGASYLRKIGDKTEPIKMDHCDPCAVRFYFYKGIKVNQ